MEDETLVPVSIRGKSVYIPKYMVDQNLRDKGRTYAVETGQASWQDMTGQAQPEGYKPEVGGPLNSMMISAGRGLDRIGSNISQAYNELVGNEGAAGMQRQRQQEMDRLAESQRDEYPISSLVGEGLPYMAVPGGLGAQTVAGVVGGALEGDTAAERIGLGALGGVLGAGGQKLGDKIGARAQNAVQRAVGSPYANQRRALLNAGVPLNLSERTDSAISKPLSRFFERARFVWSGNQPNAEKQQAALTRAITDALGAKEDKLTRGALGRIADKNRSVFRSAAERATGGKKTPLVADQKALTDAMKFVDEFDRWGSDSPQVGNIFREFEDWVTSPAGKDTDQWLQLRSKLSEMTTKADGELDAIVGAINIMDDQLARLNPSLADELQVARDRHRLLIAIRKGAALTPQGDININSFNNNIERVFRDFDIGKPLPRTLENAGEAVAGFNEVTNGFRSSQSAENAMAGGIPSLAANAAPGTLAKAAAGAILPFSGGGTGGMIGGGTARASELLLWDALNKSPSRR